MNLLFPSDDRAREEVTHYPETCEQSPAITTSGEFRLIEVGRSY